MVIWLRKPRVEATDGEAGVGVADDVIRVEQFATVVGIDEAFQAAAERAQAILAEAEEGAAALHREAQQRYDTAEQRGYDSGMQQALADWNLRHGEMLADTRALQLRLRERLADLVVTAVEQIIAVSDPAALFAKAVAEIDRIVADGSPVTMRVHPDDVHAATSALERIAVLWANSGRAIRQTVIGDPLFERGRCLCETDVGVIDASLPLQLAAMREGIARVLEDMSGDVPDADEGLAGPYPAIEAEEVGPTSESDPGSHAEHAAAGALDAGDAGLAETVRVEPFQPNAYPGITP